MSMSRLVEACGGDVDAARHMLAEVSSSLKICRGNDGVYYAVFPDEAHAVFFDQTYPLYFRECYQVCFGGYMNAFELGKLH
jgi:hypothetical protein